MHTTFTTESPVHFEKDSDEQMICTAVAMVPSVPDKENEFISEASLEAAAAGYLKNSREIWLGHEKPLTGKVELMESFLAPEGFTVGGFRVHKGSWVVKLKCLTKDIWELVKTSLRSLSVGGTAKIREVGGSREMYDVSIREISLCTSGMVAAAKVISMKSEGKGKPMTEQEKRISADLSEIARLLDERDQTLVLGMAEAVARLAVEQAAAELQRLQKAYDSKLRDIEKHNARMREIGYQSQIGNHLKANRMLEADAKRQKGETFLEDVAYSTVANRGKQSDYGKIG